MEEETFLHLGDLARLVGLSVGLIIFIVLIALDAKKAYKKGIHWIPGRALVLSALSIQLLTFLTALNTSPKSEAADSFDQLPPASPATTEALLADSVKNEVLMIHIGRVMICVFVGYLLPGMARAASKNYRTRIVALLISISFQIVSEIYAINRRSGNEDGNSVVYTGEKPLGPFVTITTATVLGSMLMLVLLLSSATLASKSIKDIISQKIPVILSFKISHGEENSWQRIEDQVLKSWIVIRVCHPEYIVARSVLVSSAGLVVTVCILVSVVGWGMEGTSRHFKNRFDWLKFTAIGLECLFIVMGWAVICCRWVTAVIYYARRPSKSTASWRAAYFKVEDFWTRQILDQLDADESRLVTGKNDILKVRPMKKTIWLPRELLPVLIMMQLGVVLFSKGCWFISEMVFCNRYFMEKFILKQWKGLTSDPYYNKFEEALEDMHMPGEKKDSVWVANRKSIQQAKDLIKEGYKEGRKCQSLITFINKKTSPNRAGRVRCLMSPELLQSCDDDHLKYLCKLHPRTLRVEKYFTYAQKHCWKMTAVALINIIVILSPLDPSDQSYDVSSPIGRSGFKAATNAMEAYSQAWEIMDLVDESIDPENHLMSRAADKHFENLQLDVKFRYWNSLQTDSESKIMEVARDAILKLAEKGKNKANAEELRHDSMDWKDVAVGNSLYKLCKSIDFKKGNVRELLDEVMSSLADIIDCCMDKAADALVENSRRWARGLDEEEVWKSLFIAGKTRGVMEELGRKPNLTNAIKFDDSLPAADNSSSDLLP